MTKALNPKVVKSNELIKASYSMDLVEHRLIGLAIYTARESNKGLRKFEHLVIKPNTYAKIFNVSLDAAYKALKDAAEKLFERQVTFRDTYEGDPRKRKTRWVSEIAYIENKAELQLIFAPAIVDEITKLEEQFTEYYLKMTANFDSQYSYRLFELVKQWNLNKVKEIPNFDLSTLREQFGLEKHEYERLDNFKKKVLDKAVKEINDHTDINISYSQIKSGRVITGFKFNVKRSGNNLKDVTPTTFKESSKLLWQTKGLTDAQIKKIAVYQKELIDANTNKISPNDHRDYPEIFEDWKAMLKDPKQVNTFHKIQELLDRKKN
jgi:plasmid replication initiation protein